MQDVLRETSELAFETIEINQLIDEPAQHL